MHRELSRLRQLLDQNGIPYVADFDEFTSAYAPDTSGQSHSSVVSVLESPSHQQQLYIGTSGHFYLTDSEESQLSASTNALREKRSFFKRRARSQSQPNDLGSGRETEIHAIKQLITIAASIPDTTTDLSGLAESTLELSLNQVNQTDLGMEFVLTLVTFLLAR